MIGNPAQAFLTPQKDEDVEDTGRGPPPSQRGTKRLCGRPEFYSPRLRHLAYRRFERFRIPVRERVKRRVKGMEDRFRIVP